MRLARRWDHANRGRGDATDLPLSRMTTRRDREFARPTRRRILTGLAGCAAAAVATRALAQGSDDPLQQLIQQNQSGAFGQNFDSTSRTIKMPTASLPTLSAATAQTTEAAIARYEQIVAAGGWPVVPPTDRLRLGIRHPSVLPLRARVTTGGGL